MIFLFSEIYFPFTFHSSWQNSYLIFFLLPAISLSLVYSAEIYILSQKCLSCGIYFLLGSLLSSILYLFSLQLACPFYLHKLYFFFAKKRRRRKKKTSLGFLIIYLGNNKSENANLAAISADGLRSKYVIQISLSIFLQNLVLFKRLP